MTEQKYSYHETEGKPLKLWDSHGAFAENAMDQLRNVARLPFVHSHVAGMPDVHWGMGATVGSVIATKGAIVPAAVGVDIGCGMMAVKTTLRAEQHKAAMVGIEARLDDDVLDESPTAYKDIGAVMEAQSDLVRIVHRLRQVVNVKG